MSGHKGATIVRPLRASSDPEWRIGYMLSWLMSNIPWSTSTFGSSQVSAGILGSILYVLSQEIASGGRGGGITGVWGPFH